MEATVKQELEQFLNLKIPAESISCVDDIVLGYLISVLEQLGEDEEFEVDEFAEMMNAYIPGFDAVNRDDVCSWMLDLAEKLAETRTLVNQNKENPVMTTTDECNSSSSSSKAEMLLSEDVVEKHQARNSSGLLSLPGQAKNTGSVAVSQDLISSNCAGYHEQTDDKPSIEKESPDNGSFSEEVSVLAEMFSDACSLEIRNCLMIANGDVESAVQMMLLKRENVDDDGKENCPEVIDFSPKAHCPSSKRQDLQQAEQRNLKEQLMARYGYVEVSQEEKTYRPILHKQILSSGYVLGSKLFFPKTVLYIRKLQGAWAKVPYYEIRGTQHKAYIEKEEKKLVRYRNNQVVSTKGERFSYAKQEESEEMKKTYVNLKPARKYRFH